MKRRISTSTLLGNRKKLRNMKVTIIPITIGAFGTVTKEFLKLLEDLAIKWRDHPNYNIIEIGQNTVKSPRDLMSLALTQTPVRNHQLTLVWRKSKRSKIIKINWKSEEKLNHPDYSIVKIGQNTEKSPGNLRKLSVSQTPVKDHLVMLIKKKFYKELETTLTDYMYQERREEEDLPALKTAFTHRYNDSRTTEKSTKEDWLQPSETILANRMTITRKQKWEEKQLYGRFKRLINNISHEKAWTCLRKGNFKRETESLLIAAQNNAIRTSLIKARK